MKKLFYLMLVVVMFNTESAKPASYIYSGAETLRAIWAYWFSKQIKAATTQEIATSTDDLSSDDDKISKKELAVIDPARFSLEALEIIAEQATLMDSLLADARRLQPAHKVDEVE